MIAWAAELAAQSGHYATDQFNNPYTVPGMRDSLGDEIWDQTSGRLTAFCQGIGTASSVLGVAQALKPRGVFDPGARAGRFARDLRRSEQLVRDAGLVGDGSPALGSGVGGRARHDRGRARRSR